MATSTAQCSSPVPASGYLTDTLATEAVSFITRRAGEKFFLYVPFTAAHSPLQAKPEVLARLDRLERFLENTSTPSKDGRDEQ